MLIRKLLLITLLSSISMASLLAQNTVHVHGTVSDPNGQLLDSVNILVSAIYADSSGAFESLYTDADGFYEVDIPGPPLNVVGTVQVSMVDCFGNLQTQTFTVFNGPSDIQADFVYCESIVIDSCLVYILQEWNPGTLPGLTAWTYANVPVDYLWSSGETTQSIYPTETGEYCVTVSFPWGCTGTDCYQFSADSFYCFNYIVSYLNNDGSYNLEAVVYGAPPYTYLWNTGETSSTISNVGPGTYCVTTSDATGCEYSSCIIVEDFQFCEVWIYEDPMTGGLTAEGYGQPPLTYVWSTGDSTQTIYPPEQGLYCVTMTDQDGCSSSSCYDYGNSCYVYIIPLYPDSNTFALQAIGGSNGQSVLYQWNTGETGDIIYPQDPNLIYCVTMTDSNGCTAEACFENYQFCYTWIDVQYVDTNSAVLTVYSDPVFGWGGMNSATYLWSNGQTGPVITVTENGEYCVTATLGPDCVTEACVYVDFDSIQYACEVWVSQYQDPTTGQWFAEAYAWGFGTFNYLWSNGDSSNIIPISAPDEYVCVTATSSFGCVAEACVDTTFNPCQVYISVDNYNTGAVLKAYSWYGDYSNQGSYVWNTGQTGSILTVTEEGTYCVTFTNNEGCSSEACVDVFFWNVDSCGVWVSVESNPFGVLATANAWGTAPFAYLWSNGNTEPTQMFDTSIPDLCVTVTDAAGCVSSDCASLIDTLDPENGINSIAGYVFADSLGLVKGEVYLFGMDVNTGTPFELIDSTDIGQQGFYSFNNLPSGVYLIKAALSPGIVGYDDFIPTYHLSSATWEEATPHILPNWLPITTDIWMKRVQGGNGTGVIGGNVSDPHHIMAGYNEDTRGLEGLPNIEVLLKNEAGEVINYTYTDAGGNFQFTNLALTTYRISYDIPGVHSPDVWVTLTAENPERLQVTLILNQSVSVDQPEMQELLLYPNPAQEEINILMPNNSLTYDIRIVDMQGREVYTGSGRSGNGILPVNVARLLPGLYHINLRGENQFYFSRFLKIE